MIDKNSTCEICSNSFTNEIFFIEDPCLLAYDWPCATQNILLPQCFLPRSSHPTPGYDANPLNASFEGLPTAQFAASLVPRPSRKAERGSGVLNDFSCHMEWG